MRTLPVLFRMEGAGRDRAPVAVFPTLPAGRTASGVLLFTCYAHVGQHATCARHAVFSQMKPAKPEEYAPLLAELRGIYERSLAPGDEAFKLRVVCRWTRGRKGDAQS